MFLTETDLINAHITEEARLNHSDIVRDLIQNDEYSSQKKKMQEGERYYIGEHDILAKDFQTAQISETEENGEEQLVSFRNPNRSNHHNVNAFHRILVDQKVSYLVGREPTIRIKDAEKNKECKDYETILTDFANEDFNMLLQEWVTGASNKGIEAVHVYYDKQGEFQYCIVPGSELIPIYDTAHEKELVELIRYYEIKVIQNGKTSIQKRVEWWTKKDVTYYIENPKEHFLLDSTISPNPAPHYWGRIDLNGMEKRREGHSWGKIPFIILKNNLKSTSDLETVKGLIDAYDLISSEGTNNFLDLIDLYWVIAGYGGETTKAIIRKLQVNKAVNISDSSGSVEAKQVELPTTGRLEFLKMLRRDIFHFGMGIDVDAEKFGTAPSGVSLKFQYELLNQKAGNLESRLKKAIRELFWFYTEDYNRKNHTSYNSSLVKIDLNKNIIVNDSEIVDMIQKSKGIVSDKTLLAKHPFIQDVNEELKELEAQEKRNFEKFDFYQELESGTNKGGEANAKEKQ